MKKKKKQGLLKKINHDNQFFKNAIENSLTMFFSAYYVNVQTAESLFGNHKPVVCNRCRVTYK